MDTHDAASGYDREVQFRRSMKNLREEKGLSMGEVARRMVDAGWPEFHQATISRMEKGQRPIRLSEAHAIAHILGASVRSMSALTEDAVAHYRLVGQYNSQAIRLGRIVDEVERWEKGVTRLVETLAALDQVEADQHLASDELEDEKSQGLRNAVKRFINTPLRELVAEQRERKVRAANSDESGTDE